jgi:hypothetical protein
MKLRAIRLSMGKEVLYDWLRLKHRDAQEPSGPAKIGLAHHAYA